MKNQFQTFGIQISPQSSQALLDLATQLSAVKVDPALVRRLAEVAKGNGATIPMGIVFPWLFADLVKRPSNKWEPRTKEWYALYTASILLDGLQDTGTGDVKTFSEIILTYNHALQGLVGHLSTDETEQFFALMGISVSAQRLSGPGARFSSLEAAISIAGEKNSLLKAYALSVVCFNQRSANLFPSQYCLESCLKFVGLFVTAVQLLDDLTDLVEDIELDIQTPANFTTLAKSSASTTPVDEILVNCVRSGDVENCIDHGMKALDDARNTVDQTWDQDAVFIQILDDYMAQLNDIKSDIASARSTDRILGKLAKLRMPS